MPLIYIYTIIYMHYIKSSLSHMEKLTDRSTAPEQLWAAAFWGGPLAFCTTCCMAPVSRWTAARGRTCCHLAMAAGNQGFQMVFFLSMPWKSIKYKELPFGEDFSGKPLMLILGMVYGVGQKTQETSWNQAVVQLNPFFVVGSEGFKKTTIQYIGDDIMDNENWLMRLQWLSEQYNRMTEGFGHCSASAMMW